jgi:hypothetical protein
MLLAVATWRDVAIAGISALAAVLGALVCRRRR